ncbi:MAG: M4 family metallopeptidase [Chloroflexi bacterium]|nr:M4 family metallopeptidase [Chloroflexota bacterium]
MVYRYSTLEDGRNRRTYTLHNTWDYPGTLLLTESSPPSADGAANAAHNNIGIVYNYYWNTFHRYSYNGAGSVLESNVHLGSNYNNAFWSSDDNAMFYGDGDGVMFSSLPYGLDVVAHELTHGVTASEANLAYHNQSGALNESYSDVFGSMVDRGDWLIGEDVYTPATPGDALRSLANPPLYGQPDHVNDFVVSSDDEGGDYGGVHTNSGIPNKAAYLIASAIGREKTEQIWYRTLTLYLTASSDFNAMRTASLAAAADLYGYASPEWKAVDNGFTSVGISRVVAQSPHPYANSYDNTWTITNPDPLATSTKVHFSALSVESGWDYVYVENESGAVLQTLSGKYSNFTSVAVPGRTVKIRLTSDASYKYWGFTVDRVISAARASTTYSIYLPVVMDNAYGGWSTGVGIRNGSASAGPVYLIYYDAMGNLIFADTATVSGNGYWGVAQGGRFGGNWAGSAVVQSNSPVKVEVNETGPGGKAMGYNGSATASTTLYLPVVLDNAYGGWTTGIGLRNTSPTAASVTIQYYNSAGIQVASETATVDGNGYWGNYQGGKLGSGFAGSAIVSSTKSVVAIVNEINTSGGSISYNGFSGGSTTVNLPVILNNAYGGVTTGVGIMNVGSSPASGSIAYYNSNGTLRTAQAINLSVRGYVGLYQGGGILPTGWAGSAVITMNQPVIAVVNESKSSGDAMGYSGVGPGATVVNLPVVMDNAYGGWNTGAGIQNTSSSSATVNVDYYSNAGVVLNTASTVVPAKGYWGLYQGGALGSGNAGSAKITSTQPIAVVVNEAGPGGSAISYNGMP